MLKLSQNCDLCSLFHISDITKEFFPTKIQPSYKKFQARELSQFIHKHFLSSTVKISSETDCSFVICKVKPHKNINPFIHLVRRPHRSLFFRVHHDEFIKHTNTTFSTVNSFHDKMP